MLHEKEDRTNGIYAVSGGYCHDIIEKLYKGDIKYEDMIDLYEDSLLTMNIAELKYDRNDAEKNEKIANKYENCVRHFFRNHNVIKQPHRIEHFITIRISDDIVLQGYIDFLFTEKYVDELLKYIEVKRYNMMLSIENLNDTEKMQRLKKEDIKKILKKYVLS